MAVPNVGRNKSARHQQGRMFPAIGAPETPVQRLTLGQADLCPVGIPAYVEMCITASARGGVSMISNFRLNQ
jgi:hypothetical protein